MSAKLERLEKLAGKKKTAPIIRALKSKDPEVRLDALHALGVCGTEDAINYLTNWSNSEDPKERIAAIKALALCGKEYSVTQMRYQLTSEKDPEVIAALKESLSIIHGKLKEKE